MIIELTPVTMAEARTLLTSREDTKPVADYFEKFTKLSEEKAVKLRKEIAALGNVKLKESHIVKIADFVPRDAEDVHKIVNDVSLNEQEVTAILDVVKNY